MAVEIKLKEIRTARGISQNELARRLEMSLANVQKIEYGKAKSIPLDTLDKLCGILECEVGELLVRVLDSEEGSSEKEQRGFQVVDQANKNKINSMPSKDLDTRNGLVAA
ncbi:transcriptional regulator (plasmid) [Nostoc sp. NIES-2111]|nr:transcriptional regulator [Nostoc sp. NIES-2111]